MTNSWTALHKPRMVSLALVVAGLFWSGDAIRAQSVLFDFDTGTPALGIGTDLPFDRTAGGITAHFSSTAGSVFSLESDGSTFFHLSRFSGKYLYPNNQDRNVLSVAFSQPLTGISIVFATVEYQDNAGAPSLLQLAALSGRAVVGTASANGACLGDPFPMGTVTFTSTAQTFDQVDRVVPCTSVGTTVFLADNLIVQTPAAGTAGSVPDGAFVPGVPLAVEAGIGGAINLYGSASCVSTDVDYGVYEGTPGAFTSHVPRVCSTSGATAATIVPGVGNMHDIVVPHNGAVEGSCGKDSASVERAASAAACFPQSIAACPQPGAREAPGIHAIQGMQP